MSARMKKILDILMQHDDFIPIKEIADQLGISSRTVLRELAYVEKWLGKRGISLERKTGAGIQLEVSREQKQKIKKEINLQIVEYIYTPEERKILLLSELLRTQEPRKLYDFTCVLNVSEATVSNDLVKVEEWLEDANLHLIRKPGLGVYIRASENKIRMASLKLFYDYFSERQLLEIIRSFRAQLSEENLIFQSKITANVFELVDMGLMHTFEQMIHNVETMLGYRLADNDFVSIILCLALAVKRIRTQHLIHLELALVKKLIQTPEYPLADQVAQKINQVYGISIPDDEVGYFIMYIRGAKTIRDIDENEISMINDFKLIRLAKEVIRIAQLETGCYLEDNHKLLIGLVRHFEPVLNRIHMNIEIRNPLTEQIEKQYPFLFQVGVKCARSIEQIENITIPKAEIAYIAMHIGAALHQEKRKIEKRIRVVVACMYGIGASQLLVARIEEAFNNIEVVEVISTIEYSEEVLLEKEIDLIISTICIPKSNVPVVVVEGLFNQQDIEKVESTLHSLLSADRVNEKDIQKRALHYGTDLKKKLNFLQGYSDYILQVLNNFELINEISIENITELIENASKIVTEKGKQEILVEDFKKREEKGSTLLRQKRMMLLHCRTKAVEEIHFVVIRLNNTFEFEKDKSEILTIIVMVAPLELKEQGLEVISEISKKIIMDKYFSFLIQKGTKEQLRRILNDILDNFYKEKNLS